MCTYLYMLFINASLVVNSNFQINCSLQRTIRVLTKHYEPFMYQREDGKFFDGIEFKLITTIAAKLQMNVSFINASELRSKKIFVSVDMITTGFIPQYARSNKEDFIASIPYLQDDFTWCVQNAGKRPVYLNYWGMTPLGVWLLGALNFVIVGTLLYFLIELEDHSTHRDWYYCMLLVAMTALIGISPRFNPKSLILRSGYFLMLIIPLPIHTAIGFFSYNYMKVQFPRYQISTTQEIIGSDYRFVGSEDVLKMIDLNTMYPKRVIESFYKCDINNCFKHLQRNENSKMAVGGSRQHILNCPEFTSTKIYCFKPPENIASYQPSLLINKTFRSKNGIDRMTRRLFETGFFVKWLRDSQRSRKYEVPYIAPLEMQLIHLYFGLFFILAIGYCVSISTFIAELIVSFKAKQQNRHRIWPLLEQFFSGHRIYFIDWPKRLQELKEKESI